MNPKAFKKNLLVYGADVRRWPKALQEAGQKALAGSEQLQALVAREEHFESVLTSRNLEAPSNDLADRIVTAARRGEKKSRPWFGGLLSEVLWSFRLPVPVRAAVSVAILFALIVGFAIGFSDPTGTQPSEVYQANLEDFLYYEGEIL